MVDILIVYRAGECGVSDSESPRQVNHRRVVRLPRTRDRPPISIATGSPPVREAARPRGSASIANNLAFASLLWLVATVSLVENSLAVAILQAECSPPDDHVQPEDDLEMSGLSPSGDLRPRR
jgi:hypothetical protein